MSTSSSDSEPEFTRRSDTESICMWCFMTVRTKRPWTMRFVYNGQIRYSVSAATYAPNCTVQMTPSEVEANFDNVIINQ